MQKEKKGILQNLLFLVGFINQEKGFVKVQLEFDFSLQKETLKECIRRVNEFLQDKNKEKEQAVEQLLKILPKLKPLIKILEGKEDEEKIETYGGFKVEGGKFVL